MRLAFVLDGYAAHAGVAVTQPARDVVRFEVSGDVDPDAAAAQAARILSLDEDATGYDRMVDRDTVLRGAYAARPGLRPPLFSSAYEALLWSLLSARRPAAQMRDVRERLARAHGRVVDVAGESVAALPTPDRLLAVDAFPGIPDVKLRRMHAVAEAARAGRLDTEALRMLDVEEATRQLRRLRGDRAVLRRAGHDPCARPHRRASHDRATSPGRHRRPTRPRHPDPRRARRAGRGLAALAHLDLRRPPRRRLAEGGLCAPRGVSSVPIARATYPTSVRTKSHFGVRRAPRPG